MDCLKNFGCIFGALAFVMSTGCDDRKASPDTMSLYETDWSVLADGSSYSKIPNRGDSSAADAAFAAASASGEESVEQTSVIPQAARCWPTEDGKFICLRATHNDDAASHITVDMSVETELPRILLGGSSPNGYRCYTILGDEVEEIKREDQTLLTNRGGSGAQEWSSSYVRRFLRDNRVDGQWFDCLKVLRALRSGSLETLSTTAVSRPSTR